MSECSGSFIIQPSIIQMVDTWLFYLSILSKVYVLLEYFSV